VDQPTLDTTRAAEQSVARLVEACRKGGPLYRRDPKAVAQVSRTARWLLNALAALHKALGTPSSECRERRR